MEEPNNRKLIILRPGVVFGKNENGNFTRLYQAPREGLERLERGTKKKMLENERFCFEWYYNN